MQSYQGDEKKTIFCEGNVGNILFINPGYNEKSIDYCLYFA